MATQFSYNNSDVMNRITCRLETSHSKGTGVLIKPTSDSLVYLITAKHCLLGKQFDQEVDTANVKISVPLEIGNESRLLNLTMTDTILPDPQNDIAVIVLRQRDLDVPRINLASTRYTQKTCFFRGYPQAYNTLQGVTISVNYVENDVISTLIPLATEHHGPLANCEGFSGSGVFCESNGQLFLTGLVYKLGEAFQQFKVCNLSFLNKLLAANNLPEVEFQHLPANEYIDSVLRSFRQATADVIRYDSFILPGSIGKVERNELAMIEELLLNGRNVVLIGEAGTGKSGIAHQLAITAQEQRKGVLLLDARNYEHIQSAANLQHELNLTDSVQNSIVRSAQYSDEIKTRGLRLVIEQFDNVANSRSGQVLTDLAIACADTNGVEIVVVTRHQGKTSNYIEKLKNKQFECVICESLSNDRTCKLLSKIGIDEPSSELVALASNLLQLSLIAQIASHKPNFDFSKPFTQIELWHKFIEVLKQAENNEKSASQLLNDVATLARTSLNAIDGTFTVEHNNPYDRLVSWQIVVPTQWKRKYRFRHQQLQTFFYASDAFERGVTPNEIVEEINRYNSHDVFSWLEKLFVANQYTTIPANYYRQIFDPTYQIIPFYSQSRVLEFYAQSEKPETNDQAFKVILRELTRQKPNDGLRLHFFKLEPSAAWSSHLLDKGILTTPPEIDYQQSYQSWDAQWYLWRIAEQLPNVVHQHMEAVNPSEWHPAHIARTIKILQRISPEQATCSGCTQ